MNEKLLKALEDFRNAAYILNKEWESAGDDALKHGYPFDISFVELVCDIDRWYALYSIDIRPSAMGALENFLKNSTEFTDKEHEVILERITSEGNKTRSFVWCAVFEDQSDGMIRTIHFTTLGDPSDDQMQSIAYEEFAAEMGIEISSDSPGDWTLVDVKRLKVF